jgi:uncharacterized membrane protein YkvA (DUF1232 family)
MHFLHCRYTRRMALRSYGMTIKRLRYYQETIVMCVLVVYLPLPVDRCPDSVGVHRYVLVELVVSL